MTKIVRHFSLGSNCRIAQMEKEKAQQQAEMQQQRPPIGLVPREIHDHKRMDDICAAASRYLGAGMEVPSEWVKEYFELMDKKHKKC